MQRKLPGFKYEKNLWKKGYQFIGGIDEVGRGSFAGPVVAGCVVFPRVLSRNSPKSTHKGTPALGLPVARHPLINDSKKLTLKKREEADKWIRENALAIGIGTVSVAQINKKGIKKATESAFRIAIKNANRLLLTGDRLPTNAVNNQQSSVNGNKSLDYLLIDAFHIPYVKGLRKKHQTPIVKGDEKSFSIAAASIIAKVHRDKYMQKLQNSKNSKLKVYNWEKNKGYGTLEHRKAILEHGITKHHRTQFVGTFVKKFEGRKTYSKQFQNSKF